MADAAKETKAESTGKASVPMMTMLVSMVAAVVVATGAIGGAGFYLVKSGRLALGTGVPAVQAAEKAEPKTKLLALDPLLVNLADPGGHSFLRVAMTLKVEDPPPAKGEKAKEEAPAKGKPVNEQEAAERDVALDVIGRMQGDELLAPEGKDKLKAALKAALTQRVPEARVDDVLFTEFLVQR